MSLSFNKFFVLLATLFSVAVVGDLHAFQEKPAVEAAATDDDEAKAKAEIRRFDEADINSNGTISRDEYKIYIKAKLPNFVLVEKLLKSLDADRNGVLSREEFGNRRAVAKRLESEPVEFQEGFNERFMDRPPLLGKQIENLVAFDENGKALSFKSLKGKHTVIIFGCLT